MYAVIFTSRRNEGDQGYGAMANEMESLAATMPGYRGIVSARGDDGVGITVSYWETEEDIARWKAEARHLVAQQLGQERWYTDYKVEIARIERAYDWKRKQP